MENRKKSEVRGKTQKVDEQNDLVKQPTVDDIMSYEKLDQILKDISNDQKILDLLKDNPVEIVKMYELTTKELEALTSADLLLVKRPRKL
ncbi:hypothetical protein [Chengkuizengella sediminis]|uniref:hypothetical protein n=1 Tax=Chengkuizengella sediminis TaxID=1885917 RepID=UPI0013897C31|nr:hypothetical protein [Chengkuizengella sediminis]NDI33559.1 hypothetical protein [Chengkuizengella sediminis]